jgi:type II secretory ATPase GspE/PulE/Tfp pilus assembly ATPase PilB-like protein
MNITERRFAQDGHISNSVLTAQRDVRVGSGPTINGERIVLRLMPDQSSYNLLEDLGFEEDQLHLVKEHSQRPSGMVMSVGPVGSGKSTTMYSCLNLLNDPKKSITTIEDPVERRISGINQIQTDPKINFGFVEALRGVLRQDPNIMMIGEIRDPETAHIGCRAALTGVMVLSTMHANDSASTIDVMREFGIPPMFIADSLNCIISQRLVRKVCPTSRETYHPDAAMCEMLGIDPSQAESTELVRGIPADENFFTGYTGRTGVFEVLEISKGIREAILKGKPAMQIREIAQSEGMMTLEQAMRSKVQRGITSIEELHRVISTYGV